MQISPAALSKSFQRIPPAGQPSPDAVAAESSSGPVDEYQPAPSRPAGHFGIEKKDGKTLLAIRADQLDKPFLLTTKATHGIGENNMVASESLHSHLVKFRQAGDRLQLVAAQTKHVASPSSPEAAEIVERSFADGLMASAAFEDNDGQYVVDARDILINDFNEYGWRLNARHRGTFRLDRENSTILEAGAHQRGNRFSFEGHFESGTTDTLTPPRATALTTSVLPRFEVDFIALPETPMRPRQASPHLGHFTTDRVEHVGDVETDVSFVQRWRLEKADPQAEVSSVVDPIVISMEETVPADYREAVRDGILEWNKAFEAIGFKDAVEVQLGESGETDATIGWHTADDRAFGYATPRADPRTGEILGGHVRMSKVFATEAEIFAQEAALLNEEGVDPTEIAQNYVKHIVTHEAGHLLGLAHNFKGSAAYTPEQLSDREFTSKHGLGSTVMEYFPINFAGSGETQGHHVMPSLGVYDYHAIKYAYQPVEAQAEEQALGELVSESLSKPELAFADEMKANGSDPLNATHDLGSDPKAFALKQMDRVARLKETGKLEPLLLEESDFKLKQAALLLTRYVGGTRDGDKGQAISGPEQKEALDEVVKFFFQADSVFSAETELQNRIMNQLFGSEVAGRVVESAEDNPSITLHGIYDRLQSAVFSELESGTEVGSDRRELQRNFLAQLSKVVSADSEAHGDTKATATFLMEQLQQKLAAAKVLPGLSIQTRIHLADCYKRAN